MRILNCRAVPVLLCVLGLTWTAGCSDRPASATAAAASDSACGVSELKANPEKYLGAVTITGKAAKVYADDGVIEIADERACCSLYLFVPFTEAQRAKLGAERLYEGTLPAAGSPITADAELKKSARGYVLHVKAVRAGDGVLIAMR